MNSLEHRKRHSYFTRTWVFVTEPTRVLYLHSQFGQDGCRMNNRSNPHRANSPNPVLAGNHCGMLAYC